MAARRENSVIAKKSVKNTCLMQALYRMVLSPVVVLYKYLGIQGVMNEISKKEKFC